MTLIWWPVLILLLAIPAGVWLYAFIGRRRVRRAGGLASLGGVVAPTGRRARIRSRVPGALFVVAMAVMVLALARPEGTVGLPIS
jgi:Ca-activated chloride channel family protein